jgi:hypothetical protein
MHYNRYHLGIKPPQSEAAARGTGIHEMVEQYVRGDDVELPAQAERHIEILETYRNDITTKSEYKLYFDKHWNSIDRDDRENRWFVAVLDAVRRDLNQVHIAEWKSGREYDEHRYQREIYAFCALRHWEECDEAHATTHYVDGKAEDKKLIMMRTAEDRMFDTWTARIETMEKDQVHAPRPGNYCRWCHYSKIHHGGTCPVG